MRRKPDDQFIMDLRGRRADEFTAMLMAIVQRHLPRTNECDAAVRAIYREIEALSYVSGVEMLTDAHRAAAGLGPRDARGWTRDELYAYDLWCQKRWLEPIPQVVFPHPSPPVHTLEAWERAEAAIEGISEVEYARRKHENRNHHTGAHGIGTPAGQSSTPAAEGTGDRRPGAGDRPNASARLDDPGLSAGWVPCGGGNVNKSGR